jgi:hypothetical protein
MAVTLPEVQITGSGDAVPQNAADWFCQGYMFGWNQPNATPSAPAPLNEDLLAAYLQGVTAGQSGRQKAESDLGDYTGPVIGPDPGGGEPYEEIERRWKEAWAEFLKKEDPHTHEEPKIEIVVD